MLASSLLLVLVLVLELVLEHVFRERENGASKAKSNQIPQKCKNIVIISSASLRNAKTGASIQSVTRMLIRAIYDDVIRKYHAHSHFSLEELLQFWFSDENMVKDKYLVDQMDNKCGISVELLATFPAVQSMARNKEELLEKLEVCGNILVNYIGTRVRFLTGKEAPCLALGL